MTVVDLTHLVTLPVIVILGIVIVRSPIVVALFITPICWLFYVPALVSC